MNQSRCKFCDAPIRWVDDNGHRLALNLVPVAKGGTFAVLGAETARRIPKADRPKYAKLYVPHNTKAACPKWEDAQAMKARQANDRVIARLERDRRAAMPENVTVGQFGRYGGRRR